MHFFPVDNIFSYTKQQKRAEESQRANILPAFEHKIYQKMPFLGKSNPKLNFVDGFWTFCLLRLSRHSKEQVLLKKFYCKFITK